MLATSRFFSEASRLRHLHYDEQQPYGTRIGPGAMYGLVNGAAVGYPAAFGQGSWWTVSFGTMLRNDAFPGVFLDVPDDHPFATDIEWAVDHHITDGYPDGTYRPGQPVNRQEMVAFLHRLAGAPSGPYPDPRLTDVPPGHPFGTAIHWAAASGVTQGYPDGRFGTTDPPDRGSAAAFFFGRAGSPGGTFPDPGFTDVPPGHPFRTEIQ